MRLDGAHLDALLDDMEEALRDLVAPFEGEPGAWDRRRGRGWTAGQHVEHIALALALTAEAAERAAERLDRGDLPPRPWRDPLQALFVGTLTRFIPRGGRAPRGIVPSPRPAREPTLARIAEGAGRHRALAERLTSGQRDRLWFWNPFYPRLRWHYRLPETVRVHAVHTRHHLGLVRATLGIR